MKKFLILLLALVPMVAIQAKPNKQTVVLYCDLHCQGCCDKIMKNIAFEKGVKDIQFDMEQQAVTVTYDADKTDVPTLQKAFAKIGKPATTRQPESAEHADHNPEKRDSNRQVSTRLPLLRPARRGQNHLRTHLRQNHQLRAPHGRRRSLQRVRELPRLRRATLAQHL